MFDKKNNSLDSLFDDADQGICSNGTQGNNDNGLTSLNEGLTTITHSLNFDTHEKKGKED